MVSEDAFWNWTSGRIAGLVLKERIPKWGIVLGTTVSVWAQIACRCQLAYERVLGLPTNMDQGLAACLAVWDMAYHS